MVVGLPRDCIGGAVEVESAGEVKDSTDRQDVFCVAFALVAVVAAVGGCGGGKGGSDGGGKDASSDGGGTLTAADEAFIADLCAAVVPCCATHGLTASSATCKQSLSKMAQSRDPQVRAACLGEVRQLAALRACMPDVVDFGDPCARLLNEPSGPRAPGETCASTAECAGTAGTVTMCVQATCISYAVGREGAYPCLGNKFSNGATDLIPWKSGSSTPESHAFVCPKRAGLYCDWNDNTCKPLQPGGGACTLSDGCASRWCQNDGTCLPLPGAGETCVIDCSGDSYCDRTVCIPKLAAGATCDATRQSQCVGDCQGSDLCSGSCEDGVCSPLNLAEDGLLRVWCGTTPFNG